MRTCVEQFAYAMEKKLQENDHKPGWGDASPRDLFRKLMEEVGELATCVVYLNDPSLPAEVQISLKEDLVKEAADVANLAMMIADQVRGWSSWHNGS